MILRKRASNSIEIHGKYFYLIFRINLCWGREYVTQYFQDRFQLISTFRRFKVQKIFGSCFLVINYIRIAYLTMKKIKSYLFVPIVKLGACVKPRKKTQPPNPSFTLQVPHPFSKLFAAWKVMRNCWIVFLGYMMWKVENWTLFCRHAESHGLWIGSREPNWYMLYMCIQQ